MKFFSVLFLIMLSACQSLYEDHGYIEDKMAISEIQKGIGRLNHERIYAIMGPPSFVMPFDPRTWYYVAHDIERKAFFFPKVTDSLAYVVSFDERGLLSSVRQAEGPLPVTLCKRQTPLPSLHGEEFLKQMFRNLGRFPPVARPSRI